MKKKIIFSILILLVLSLSIYFFGNKKNYQIISNEKTKQIVNSNTLTMMYETEAGSGEYQVVSGTAWPQEGYIFNERLSGCENGGMLSWNSDTKRVVMQTNSSDK